jgi:KUP system potassium uptake protein
VFLTQSFESTPPAFLQNVRHNKVLHRVVVFLKIVTARVPIIPRAEQLHIGQFSPDIYHVTVRHGFMETPEIPIMLQQCHERGVPIDLDDTTYFSVALIRSPRPSLAWHCGENICLSSCRATPVGPVPF